VPTREIAETEVPARELVETEVPSRELAETVPATCELVEPEAPVREVEFTAEAEAVVDPAFKLYHPQPKNYIGAAGGVGFGVGICPVVPSGFVELPGTRSPGYDNHGNYQYADGSIMVWIPAFYYRIGHVDNPTYAAYGANAVDVLPESAFADVAAANAAGYALHRSFVDGGAVKRGVMVDKYLCSKNALGSGYIGSSIKNGLPISCSSAHNPILELTAASANAIYSMVDCAHARDGVDGAVNPESIFFCNSRFTHAALALLALAHGQAAAGATFCAWYDASGVANVPKGCNDSYSDYSDATVIWEPDGYSTCGKTGSAGYGGGAGNVFAKSTHNGQNCGVSDVQGLMSQVNLGYTITGIYTAIAGMTRANPCVVAWPFHGLVTGKPVYIRDITQPDWSGLNGRVFSVTRIDDNSFSLDGMDTSGFAADYDAVTDPGTMRRAFRYHVAKESFAMKDFTSGTTAATDHWDVDDFEAFDALVPALRTDYPNNGADRRFGNDSNQVLSADISGNGWLLTGLGFPGAASGISAAGSDLFRQAYFNQYILDAVGLASGGDYNDGIEASPWAVRQAYSRSAAVVTYGYRCACYPV